jgi:hypothetical protein
MASRNETEPLSIVLVQQSRRQPCRPNIGPGRRARGRKARTRAQVRRSGVSPISDKWRLAKRRKKLPIWPIWVRCPTSLSRNVDSWPGVTLTASVFLRDCRPGPQTYGREFCKGLAFGVASGLALPSRGRPRVSAGRGRPCNTSPRIKDAHRQAATLLVQAMNPARRLGPRPAGAPLPFTHSGRFPQ